MTITLDTARYLSLQTFRKNGDPVSTPVWFAEAQGKYYCYTPNHAGKVKRLRNSSQSKVAPCDGRGNLLGEWIETQATLVESEDEQALAFRLLRQKYGWQMGIGDLFARLSGRIHRRTVIVIRPQEQ